MDNELKVTCPCCKTILVMDRKGKILEQRHPIVEESSGDRFEDAFAKVRGAKQAAEAKFEAAKEKEKGKMARLESLFSENLKRVKESGEELKPQREMDLD